MPYAKLPAGDVANLNKLAVLKVNGGLGTSMGVFPVSRLRFSMLTVHRQG